MTDSVSVLSRIADLGVEMVDIKFSDLLGTWQHCTVPLRACDEGLLSRGLGFDGSSIRGWQEIHVSDLVAIPDPSTLRLDPFFETPTASLIANVVDPSDGSPYARDPRLVARRASEYLTKSGIADLFLVGPEPEFFVFDHVSFEQDERRGMYEVDSAEAAWNTARNDGPNLGHRPNLKGGYFPVSPTDSLQNLRSEMVSTLERLGIAVEAHHHEVGAGGQCEIDMAARPMLEMADQFAWFKYVIKNVAYRHGKTATFMPKPVLRENGNGMHVHLSLWKQGKPLFAGDQYAGLSELALHAVGGLLLHAPALMALAAPTTNSYRRLVPGFEAPVHLTYSARNRSAAIRIPMYSDQESAKRLEFRCPDPCANGYLLFGAILMACVDGIKNQRLPEKPFEQNLYEAGNSGITSIPRIPTSLGAALDALEEDHDFLLEGNVFTRSLITEWIRLKRDEEVARLERRPHPFEFELYYAS